MDQVTQILGALGSAGPKERDKAALELRDIAEAGVLALLNAIHDPANKNHRGTLVYVLEVFNCTKHFAALFSLAVTGNYEVQCHALSILQEQHFDPTAQELREAKQQLDDLEKRQDSPPKTGLLCNELREVVSRLPDPEFRPQPHPA